jgi:hypothetical protein
MQRDVESRIVVFVDSMHLPESSKASEQWSRYVKKWRGYSPIDMSCETDCDQRESPIYAPTFKCGIAKCLVEDL